MIFDTKLIFAVASLAGFAVATTPTSDPVLSDPIPTDTPCYDGIICVDSFSCGIRYGGCYNPCRDPAPEKPSCPPSTITPTPTPTPPPTEEEEEDNCSTRIVCVDAINECGIPYGGCIPDCRPWDLTTPPCPTSTFATVTQKTSAKPTAC